MSGYFQVSGTDGGEQAARLARVRRDTAGSGNNRYITKKALT